MGKISAGGTWSSTRRGRKLSVEAVVAAGGAAVAEVMAADEEGMAVVAVVEAGTAVVADVAEIVETAETAGKTGLPD
jgi:hypothetical protein